MILYFSGTGNSKYAAEIISSIVDDEIISLNEIIKNKKSTDFNSEKPYIVVCPVYAWRIPRIVENIIKKSEFNGSKKIYFVLTCGDSSGNAYNYAKKLSEEKGLIFKGLKAVVMPENYIAMFNSPNKAEAEKIIALARPKIISISETIKAGGELAESPNILGKFLSGFVNKAFYPLFVSAKGFYTTEKCIGCGKCVTLCPLNNITLKGKKPVWGNNCTHCMACICHCPTESIEYKNKSKNKPRYYI